MVSINLKDEELNIILTKSILDSLSEEMKNKIIGDAVNYLNTPIYTNSYNDPNKDKTVLQVAFQNAVNVLIDRVVLEILQDRMYAKIKEKVADLLVEFPDIKTDPSLQVKVASTMMEHMKAKENNW